MVLAKQFYDECKKQKDFAKLLLRGKCTLEAKTYLGKIRADCRRYQLEIKILFGQTGDEIEDKKHKIDEYYAKLTEECKDLPYFN